MDGGKLLASVAGVVEKVNKLICVQPLQSRYVGEIGDVVVGRVTEVGQRRWKVDCQARLDAVLMLSSVNLPGGVLVRTGVRPAPAVCSRTCRLLAAFGMRRRMPCWFWAPARWTADAAVGGRRLTLRSRGPARCRLFCGDAFAAQRRRSAADELMMRQFFVEGDVISCEVQSIFHDGVLSLHTRSLKYGKLDHGTFVLVSPTLVKRCKNHFHSLPCGVGVVLGNNGYIWIGQNVNTGSAETLKAAETKPAADDDSKVEMDVRHRIARVRNIVLALASQKLSIFDTSIIYSYEDSEHFSVTDLLRTDVAAEVTARAREVCARQ